VRQGQQNRRGRGRNNRKSHNPLARSFESNGPDVKIRGTPAHIAEKYLSLARDAQSSGDPVLAENYLQHAEHYSRIIMAYREQLQQPGDVPNGHGQRLRAEGDIGEEFGDDDGEEALDDAFHPPQPQQPQPPVRQHAPYEGNRHDSGRHDRGGYRRDHGRFRDRDRDRQGEGRPQTHERPQEPVEAGGEPRRRERFQQAPHEQPEFLRRPVRRSRGEGEEGAAPAKEEPSRD
jgi:hypothetical protein